MWGVTSRSYIRGDVADIYLFISLYPFFRGPLRNLASYIQTGTHLRMICDLCSRCAPRTPKADIARTRRLFNFIIGFG